MAGEQHLGDVSKPAVVCCGTVAYPYAFTQHPMFRRKQTGSHGGVTARRLRIPVGVLRLGLNVALFYHGAQTSSPTITQHFEFIASHLVDHDDDRQLRRRERVCRREQSNR